MRNIIYLTFFTLTLLSCNQEIKNNTDNKVTVSEQIMQQNVKWRPGQKIKVLFLDGDDKKHGLFMDAADTWTRYANLKFDYHKITKARSFLPLKFLRGTIRVSFNEEADSYSPLGEKSFNDGYIYHSSMNIGYSLENEEMFKSTVIHEMGHALGLQHEHQHIDTKSAINEENYLDRCKYLYNSHLSKDPTDEEVTRQEIICRHNLLPYTEKDIEENNFDMSEYDQTSIMHYNSFRTHEIASSMLYDTSLSLEDKRFIAKHYPMIPPLTDEEIERMHIEDEENEVSYIINRYSTEECPISFNDEEFVIYSEAIEQGLKVKHFSKIKESVYFCNNILVRFKEEL